ncbi:hypothetical protein JCM9140_4431 [Halalkalibacter wakoensis JCM 9140]|uniref:Lipoprotein n=1 Tax=Halalkalibacter wakoensis JCM 9140 TaxID=1236970 RepID=W4Q822_9BACI|nr:hypothetical protein [Halalkalibacter wakoensis]GAE28221.1 hypothetical protein JCM9140_4431 [Halalkalibacter wakoensis JCM 9140]
MKKVLILYVICLFIVAGCAAGSETVVEPIESALDDEQKVKDELDEGISFDQLVQESLFQFTMVDHLTKLTYDVFLHAEETAGQIDATSSQESEGDFFYEGFYDFYLVEDGEHFGVKQDHLSLFSSETGDPQWFSKGEDMAYVSSHESGRDLLVVHQKEETEEISFELFLLEDGQLHLVEVEDHRLNAVNGEIRNIGEGLFQHVEYNNDEASAQFGWVFQTWELDEELVQLSLISESIYNDETHVNGLEYGRELFDKWSNDPGKAFAYPHIAVSEEWLASAKDGRFPGIPFAVGTKLQHVFDQKGEPDAITDWLGGAETFIYDNIGYAVPVSGDNAIDTLLIPGVVIEGDVRAVIETLGEPDEEFVDYDNVEVMIYNTGAYALYIEKTQNEIHNVLISQTSQAESISEWSGVYAIPPNSGVGGQLTISDEDQTGFLFDIHVSTTHVGEIEGYAVKNGNTALQVPDEYGCQMTLIKEGNQMTTIEGDECWIWSGMAIDLNHTFYKQ